MPAVNFLTGGTAVVWQRNKKNASKMHPLRFDHNFLNIDTFLMKFVPFESSQSQLSNGAKIIKNGYILRKIWRNRTCQRAFLSLDIWRTPPNFEPSPIDSACWETSIPNISAFRYSNSCHIYDTVFSWIFLVYSGFSWFIIVFPGFSARRIYSN